MAGLAASVAVVCAALAQPAEDGARLRVLSPLDGSTVAAGPVDCLVRAAGDTALELRVDGQVHPWDLTAGAALLATLDLAPGEHEVTLGDQTVRFAVTAEEGRTDLVRAHSRQGNDVAACGVCHEVTEGENPEVRSARAPDACLACHSRTDFDLAHFHPLEPIRNCWMCHALHGSARAALLSAPASKLCAACHE